jgi:hypothetical protein
MKTKFTLVLLFACVIFVKGNGQSVVVCEGDVMLSSQADVNAFNCAKITGTLWISGTDITDLAPLQVLTSVGGLIITESNSLTNVDGLSGLQEITGFFGTPYVIGIAGNASLKNLDGLSSLKTETVGSISISNNPLLETINGFSSVKTVLGLFSIANNASLRSMDGFKNITAVRDAGFQPYLLIDNNPSLENLDGFSSLEVLNGNGANLEISNNPKLNNINGLSSLTTISGGGRGTGLFIKNNDALPNIDGLSSLTILSYGVAGAIDISNNTVLKNVNGISNVTVPLGNFRLTVTKNPALQDCSGLFPIMLSFGLEYVSTNNFRISENGSGCTLEDIIANGPPVVTAFSIYNKRTGQMVTAAFNNHLTIDISDPDYPYWVLNASTLPGKVGSVTFKNGDTKSQTDNQSPFQFDFQSLSPGVYTVVTDAYSKTNKHGIKGLTRTLTLTIQNSAAILGFDVVDMSGNILKTLQEGDEINIKDPVFQYLNVVANVYPDRVHHVKFWLNNRHHRTERAAPYAAGGDSNGTYYPWSLRPGSYTLRAVPFVRSAKKEFAGQPLEIHFNIIAESINAVINYSVVDISGKILRQLNDGDVLDVNDSELRAFNIIANTSGPVGSVKFRLNDRNYRTENVVAYSLAGDQHGKFNSWKADLGDHSLSAVPYSHVNGQGVAGKELKIRFKVVNGSSLSQNAAADNSGSLAVSLFPVPLKEDLFLQLDNSKLGNVTVVLRNNQGHTVYTGSYDSQQFSSYAIKTSGLPSGIYHLQLRGANGFDKVIRVVK